MGATSRRPACGSPRVSSVGVGVVSAGRSAGRTADPSATRSSDRLGLRCVASRQCSPEGVRRSMCHRSKVAPCARASPRGNPQICGWALIVIGRRRAIERIDRLLAAASEGRAGALVIVGEAGIGKSTLLDHVDADAVGFQRLRVRGVPNRSPRWIMRGLLQLVTPVRHHLDAVPVPQRRALEAAVGWGPSDVRRGPLPGCRRNLVAASPRRPSRSRWWCWSMTCTGSTSGRQPPFCSRPAGSATTPWRSSSPPATDHHRHRHRRTRQHDPRRPRHVRCRGAARAGYGTGRGRPARHAATHGNPLALIEIGAQLSPAQRRGAAVLPDALPAGDRLEAVYEPVVASLSAAGRHAVMLAAASRDNAIEPVVAALRARLDDPEVASRRRRSSRRAAATNPDSCGSVTRCCGQRHGPRRPPLSDAPHTPRWRQSCPTAADERAPGTSPRRQPRPTGHSPPSSRRSPTRIGTVSATPPPL